MLTTALDPLPHLYTVYSDKLESEDRLSVPANGNDETDQATSGLSESDSSRSGAQGSTREGSQHSYASTLRPLSSPPFENALSMEDESDLTSAPASPHSAVSAQRPAGSDFEIDRDFSSSPPASVGHTKRVPFTSKVPGTRYMFHQDIIGERLFIINALIADSVDQENLADKTAVIRSRKNGCAHFAHRLQTQPIGEHSRARRGLKRQSCCTARLKCRKRRSTPF